MHTESGGSPCLPAASHPHRPPSRPEGSTTRWSRRPTRLTTKCCLLLSSLSWEDLPVGLGRGEGTNIISVCAGLQEGFALCREDQGRGKGAPGSLWGSEFTSHNPSTAEVLAPPQLGEWSQPYLCPPAPQPAPRRDDALGSSGPSSRGPKQQGRASVTEWEGWSEERSLFLEFIPLPQGQLAKLFGRHGEYP